MLRIEFRERLFQRFSLILTTSSNRRSNIDPLL